MKSSAALGFSFACQTSARTPATLVGAGSCMLQGQQTASSSISSRASIGTQADRHLLHLHRMSYVISRRTPLLLSPPHSLRFSLRSIGSCFSATTSSAVGFKGVDNHATPAMSEQFVAALKNRVADNQYISHIKVREHADNASGAPAQKSAYKTRYIILGQSPSQQRAYVYKARRNANGTLSIGKEWDATQVRSMCR